MSKLINSILNNDIDIVMKTLDSHPEQSVLIGECGETAIHVAIYKRNAEILSQLLLKSKATPSTCNSKGEPAFYITVKIGWFQGMKICYEIDPLHCNLFFINSHKISIYELACALPSDDDLREMYLFSDVEPLPTAAREEMIHERSQCVSFLKIQLLHQLEFNCKRLTQDATTLFNKRLKLAQIVNGPTEMEYLTYNVKILFPRGDGGDDGDASSSWSEEDKDMFFKNEKSLRDVCVNNFSHSFVNRSVYSAFASAIAKTL